MLCFCTIYQINIFFIMALLFHSFFLRFFEQYLTSCTGETSWGQPCTRCEPTVEPKEERPSDAWGGAADLSVNWELTPSQLTFSGGQWDLGRHYLDKPHPSGATLWNQVGVFESQRKGRAVFPWHNELKITLVTVRRNVVSFCWTVTFPTE